MEKGRGDDGVALECSRRRDGRGWSTRVNGWGDYLERLGDLGGLRVIGPGLSGEDGLGILGLVLVITKTRVRMVVANYKDQLCKN